MTRRQTFIAVFIFAVLVSLFLLAVTIKVNDHLEESKSAIIELQRQIDRLKNENQDIKKSLAKINHTTEAINKDIDSTQELQRKQAQAILELRKGKRK